MMNNKIDLDTFKVFNELLSADNLKNDGLAAIANNCARLYLVTDVKNINSL